MLKPTFTDVNGVKVRVTISTEADAPHMIVSTMSDDGTLSPILEMNIYDATYLQNACEVFLKQAASVKLTASLAGLSPDEMADQFDYEGDPSDH